VRRDFKSSDDVRRRGWSSTGQSRLCGGQRPLQRHVLAVNVIEEVYLGRFLYNGFGVDNQDRNRMIQRHFQRASSVHRLEEPLRSHGLTAMDEDDDALTALAHELLTEKGIENLLRQCGNLRSGKQSPRIANAERIGSAAFKRASNSIERRPTDIRFSENLTLAETCSRFFPKFSTYARSSERRQARERKTLTRIQLGCSKVGLPLGPCLCPEPVTVSANP